MFKFKIWDYFSSGWADCISLTDPKLPVITIMTPAHAEKVRRRTGSIDSRYQLIVDAHALDDNAIRLALASALEVGNPEDIDIQRVPLNCDWCEA